LNRVGLKTQQQLERKISKMIKAGTLQIDIGARLSRTGLTPEMVWVPLLKLVE
jgi:hypothetical protein